MSEVLRGAMQCGVAGVVALTELARAVRVPLALLGRPILCAAETATDVAGVAAHALGGLCAEARPKGLESSFLSLVRSCREPQWVELQELLEEEADEIFRYFGLDACEQVSAEEFQRLRPRLLERCMELAEDMKVVFEKIDRRPCAEDEDIDIREVKAIFHLVLQARTDVIASMLHGDLTGVWRRIGDNTSGLVSAQGLHIHARNYAERLPTGGIHFSEDDVAALADRFASVYGNLPLEPRELSALIQDLYFELLMMAWSASPYAEASVPSSMDLVPALSGNDRSPGHFANYTTNDSKSALNDAILAVAS